MFWRFVIATFAFSIVIVREALIIPVKVIPTIIINSIFMFLYNFFYFNGTQIGLTATEGVPVTTLNPIFTAIFQASLSMLRFREKVVSVFVLD